MCLLSGSCLVKLVLPNVKASLSKQYQVASYADTNTFGSFTRNNFLKLCSTFFILEAFIGTDRNHVEYGIRLWHLFAVWDSRHYIEKFERPSLHYTLCIVFTGGVTIRCWQCWRAGQWWADHSKHYYSSRCWSPVTRSLVTGQTITPARPDMEGDGCNWDIMIMHTCFHLLMGGLDSWEVLQYLTKLLLPLLHYTFTFHLLSWIICASYSYYRSQKPFCAILSSNCSLPLWTKYQ